ncbi:unannotated protein [freshwater metagenome]|uniref:Unannotated protein n=1 Tax=freshwater metagenome TaxID=449393 RepID=A0A6J6VMM0_9ZZZZ
MDFGEQGATGIQRFVATTCGGIGNNSVHDDFATGVINSGGFTTQGDRESLRRNPHSAQGPDIVVI